MADYRDLPNKPKSAHSHGLQIGIPRFQVSWWRVTGEGIVREEYVPARYLECRAKDLGAYKLRHVCGWCCFVLPERAAVCCVVDVDGCGTSRFDGEESVAVQDGRY